MRNKTIKNQKRKSTKLFVSPPFSTWILIFAIIIHEKAPAMSISKRCSASFDTIPSSFIGNYSYQLCLRRTALLQQSTFPSALSGHRRRSSHRACHQHGRLCGKGQSPESYSYVERCRPLGQHLDNRQPQRHYHMSKPYLPV